jgi:hypothetical protein
MTNILQNHGDAVQMVHDLDRKLTLATDALEIIASWRTVNLQGEYETGLRGVIRSITDLAQCTLDAINS